MHIGGTTLAVIITIVIVVDGVQWHLLTGSSALPTSTPSATAAALLHIVQTVTLWACASLGPVILAIALVTSGSFCRAALVGPVAWLATLVAIGRGPIAMLHRINIARHLTLCNILERPLVCHWGFILAARIYGLFQRVLLILHEDSFLHLRMLSAVSNLLYDALIALLELTCFCLICQASDEVVARFIILLAHALESQPFHTETQPGLHMCIKFLPDFFGVFGVITFKLLYMWTPSSPVTSKIYETCFDVLAIKVH